MSKLPPYSGPDAPQLSWLEYKLKQEEQEIGRIVTRIVERSNQMQEASVQERIGAVAEIAKAISRECGALTARCHEHRAFAWVAQHPKTVDLKLPEAPVTHSHEYQAALDLMKADLWAEHPDYERAYWRQVVEAGNTQRGYWDWVLAQIEEAEVEVKPPHSMWMTRFLKAVVADHPTATLHDAGLIYAEYSPQLARRVIRLKDDAMIEAFENELRLLRDKYDPSMMVSALLR